MQMSLGWPKTVQLNSHPQRSEYRPFKSLCDIDGKNLVVVIEKFFRD